MSATTTIKVNAMNRLLAVVATAGSVAVRDRGAGRGARDNRYHLQPDGTARLPQPARR